MPIVAYPEPVIVAIINTISHDNEESVVNIVAKELPSLLAGHLLG